ncbi:MAG TPA: hypothetical protein VF595_04020 [Tepidisphaeraceae bacterium]|jgi:hypothetical protein
MDTAFDTDPMLKLLTDALRRGPGSPEWHRAVGALRDVTTPEADEYKLLITARERLESGRAYREVRAGPAFTRELFGRIDAPAEQGRRISAASFVRLLCLLTLVGVIAMGVMWVAQAKTADAQALSNRLFITPVRSWSFATMPSDLRTAGPLPLEVRNSELRPGGGDTNAPTGGVVYADEPLNLTSGACVEMRIDYEPTTTSVQLSLAAKTDAVGPLASLGQELSLVCDAGGVRLSSASASTTSRSLTPGSHLLRIKVLGDAAVAEVDGQVIWSGTQTLGPRAYAAVRFVRDGRAGDVGVRSLRVLAP